ncbi:hypothetical protein [Streptomyces sp. NPDC051162]|uniref:hypothetical protein n=1 Tax=Streptomyces sp. NPDC051162 TaxID=3154747 RepID=UPI00342E4198
MSKTRTRALFSCAALALGAAAVLGGAGMSSAASAAPSAQTHGNVGSGPYDDSDDYAYGHACSADQLSVRVVPRSEAPSQRVIEVRSLAANSCGLSYYPLVSIGDPNAADHSHDIKPLIPGGLGGPPAYALHAGRTAYAVIDLDPTGKAAPQEAELNVLAHSDMPNADTLNFPLGKDARVLEPKLGLYEDNVADAVRSMTLADTQS